MSKNPAWLSRTELLIGDASLKKLLNSHVLIIGLGGVGSYAAEFIARSGVGKMTIVDGDEIEASNINRQLPALTTNIGASKAAVMAARLKDINPSLELNVIKEFITPEAVAAILNYHPDFIIDAIDSITPKIKFILQAMAAQIPMVSSMGAGGKMDVTQIKIADISKTYNCPFAQEIRKQLKMRYNIRKGLQTVFSPEIPSKESLMLTQGARFKKSSYGTLAYMPAALGGACAMVAIQHLIEAN